MGYLKAFLIFIITILILFIILGGGCLTLLAGYSASNNAVLSFTPILLIVIIGLLLWGLVILLIKIAEETNEEKFKRNVTSTFGYIFFILLFLISCWLGLMDITCGGSYIKEELLTCTIIIITTLICLVFSTIRYIKLLKKANSKKDKE